MQVLGLFGWGLEDLGLGKVALGGARMITSWRVADCEFEELDGTT